ncbi:unnamed protein product [Agarophyton chilense]
MSNIPSARPSFFEVYAAEQLGSALRPAFRYLLETLSVRNPYVLRVANWSDEVFSSLLLVLETFQLNTDSALLSESFYSLRRSAVGSFEPILFDAPLTNPHILGSVLCGVIIPYIRAKLDSWYSAQTGGAAAVMLQELQFPAQHVEESVNPTSRTPTSMSARLQTSEARETLLFKLKISFLRLLNFPSILIRLTKNILRHVQSEAFKRQLIFWYPKIRALVDAVNLIYGMSYLYGHSKYYNLSLAMQGLILRRVSTIDLLRLSSVLLDSTGRSKPNLLQVIRNFTGKVIGVLRIAFYASVFGFRFLQYYYAAEAAAPKDIGAVIPPPAPLEPASGVNRELAKEPGKCPVCHQNRTNSTACTTSGYVFCYLCIVSSLQRTQKCPVTSAPATVDDLVRVYENGGDV